MDDQQDPPWDARDKDERLIEALVSVATTNGHLRAAVDLLSGVAVQLTAAVVRLEARLGHASPE